jgi:hypothetical protein
LPYQFNFWSAKVTIESSLSVKKEIKNALNSRKERITFEKCMPL